MATRFPSCSKIEVNMRHGKLGDRSSTSFKLDFLRCIKHALICGRGFVKSAGWIEIVECITNMKSEVEERRNECNTVSQMAKKATISSLHGKTVAKSNDLHHTPICKKHRKTNVVVRTEHKEAKDALLDVF